MRPERFELPTFWFVGRFGFSRLFEINKLDGPPSLYVPLNFVKSRRVALQPYARYEIGERWFLDAGRRYLSAGEVTMDGEGAGKCATPRPVEKSWAQRPKQVSRSRSTSAPAAMDGCG